MSDPVQPVQVTRVSLPVTLIFDVPVGPDKVEAFLREHVDILDEGVTIPVGHVLPDDCKHVRLYSTASVPAGYQVEDSQ